MLRLGPWITRIRLSFPLSVTTISLPFFLEFSNGSFIIVTAKYGASSHEHIHAGLRDSSDCAGIHTTVDLNQGGQFTLTDDRLQLAHFFQGDLDGAFAWLDAPVKRVNGIDVPML